MKVLNIHRFQTSREIGHNFLLPSFWPNASDPRTPRLLVWPKEEWDLSSWKLNGLTISCFLAKHSTAYSALWYTSQFLTFSVAPSSNPVPKLTILTSIQRDNQPPGIHLFPLLFPNRFQNWQVNLKQIQLHRMLQSLAFDEELANAVNDTSSR